jgi:hypothetical protein
MLKSMELESNMVERRIKISLHLCSRKEKVLKFCRNVSCLLLEKNKERDLSRDGEKSFFSVRKKPPIMIKKKEEHRICPFPGPFCCTVHFV